MKLLFISVIFFFQTSNSSKTVSDLRYYFSIVSESKANVEKLKQLSSEAKQLNQAVKTGYYASAVMAEAKFKFDPFSKLSAFNNGKKILESCVSADSSLVELRYIRLAIQKNVPSILGYSSNITSDKKFLLNNVSKIKESDTELYSKISAFLITQFKLTEPEKKLLNL